MAAKVDAEKMLDELAGEVRMVAETVSKAAMHGNDMLNAEPQQGKWSVAQIVEHLNTYNRYYVPYMQKMLGAARAGDASFKSGWLGNYFTKSMYSEVRTADRIANKMSAMKGHIPAARHDSAAVINEFLTAQQQLLDLLIAARGKDLGSVKIPVTISRFIRISLGDAMCFLVAHQVRHLLQVKNTLKAIGV